MTTSLSVGLPPLTPVGLGAPEGTVYGDMALGVVCLMIVVGCWLFVRGWDDPRPFVARRSLRALRAQRAMRAELKHAARAARERKRI